MNRKTKKVKNRGEKEMFKRHEGTLDRIVHLALATVLVPTGLFWLGGVQGSTGGLFAAGIGGLALIIGLTGVGALYIPTLEPESKPSVEQNALTRNGLQTRRILQGEFNMRPNLLKTVCAAVALAAGAVVITINTLATMTNTVTPMSASDAIAFLAFGVAALGMLGLQRA